MKFRVAKFIAFSWVTPWLHKLKLHNQQRFLFSYQFAGILGLWQVWALSAVSLPAIGTTWWMQH